MSLGKILWADDEIDLLKPHILFLKEKGYEITTVNNGDDAIDVVLEENFDIVFLDENMPGISGLEALSKIKEVKNNLPIVMITKSEEEAIMEDAIGSKIADYLIKPVNPNQILLCLKKNLNQNTLVSQKTNSNYQQEFRQLGLQMSVHLDFTEWSDLYKKLVFWELELDQIQDKSMKEILVMQKKEANQLFSKYIEKNYLNWLNQRDQAPLMIQNVIKDKIVANLGKQKTALIVIDNLRYDQWKTIEPIVNTLYDVINEEMISSILPTATQYARNALFSGLMPSEMAKKFPNFWVNEEEEGGKNLHEKDFLDAQLTRLGKSSLKWSYNKVTTHEFGKKIVEQFNNLKDNDFNVIVYNFVDMLSHARTEMEVIRELAEDESAYRSITKSWFNHSPLFDLFKKLKENSFKVFITTDHGTIKVNNPVKIIGDKNVNTNLRYKTGKNLSYQAKEVFTIKNPDEAYLPKSNISSEFVFARENDFFVYPNNYNHFVNYYSKTFQHGGISMEEMLIPFVELNPK
ncbi:MAG: bifunctional response regulator/alkaline phosphatase family protein [Flavobacteriia bacterium]|nr:bifunctional response regulator/alkaline phosphatase family protein [Flavobacteriia bacterium]